MSAYTYKTIMVKGAEFALQDEAKAGEAGIYPGHFLKYQTDGDFELQDESETVGPALVAVEDTLQGKKISEAYTSGEQCLARWIPVGGEVFAWGAPGHSVARSALMTFAGYESPGALGNAQQSSANLGTGVMFMSLEAVDNSSGVVQVRILVKRIR